VQAIGQSVRVKPPPECLPHADSTKWHSRRVWDSLGYIRVRTIANPSWPRDAHWLIRVFEAERPQAAGDARDLINQSIAAAKTYRRMQKRGSETDDEFSQRRDQQWDAMLVPLDAYLELMQYRHLQALRRAGKSGPQVPEG
jgi:hypothetical protein